MNSAVDLPNVSENLAVKIPHNLKNMVQVRLLNFVRM
jgi:hypothetical protein